MIIYDSIATYIRYKVAFLPCASSMPVMFAAIALHQYNDRMPRSSARAKRPSPPRSPAVKGGDKRVVFTASVPGELLRRFDALALRQNRSRAGMIMMLMQQAVESDRP